MIFRFENIGPITRADLALGDFTIIAGRNNTGKTYAVYALYGFLKNWRALRTSRTLIAQLPHLRLTSSKLHSLANDLATSGTGRISVSDNALMNARFVLVDRLASHFSDAGLPAVFSSTSDAFENAKLHIALNDDLPGHGFTPVDIETPGKNRLIAEYKDGHIVVSFVLEGNNHYGPHAVARMLSPLLFIFLCPRFPQPFILSAERFGISLFYKELDFTKNQLLDLLQNIDDRSRSPYLIIDKTLSRYSQPIKDNIEYTRGLSDLKRMKNSLADREVFNDVRDMMGGDYRATDDAIRFRSKTRGKRRFDVPLHLASSSVRGLSDLYFYLRHKATDNDLLIIDEPESHLDTRNQIAVARLLSRLVRMGIRILVTTHSDYLLKEINNLVMLHQVASVNGDAIREFGYTEQDALDPTRVLAYVADRHTLKRATVDEYGVDMPLFDDAIDDINHISNSLSAFIDTSKS